MPALLLNSSVEVCSYNAVKVSLPPSCLSHHYFWPWLVALCTSPTACPLWPCFFFFFPGQFRPLICLQQYSMTGEESDPDEEDGCGVDRSRSWQ